MPEAPDNTPLDRALSAEQVTELCAVLAATPDLTGEKIREIVKERYGLEIGKTKAYTFKNDTFAKHLEQLRSRSALAKLLQENSNANDQHVIADAASGLLAEQLLEVLMEASAGFDLTNKDDRQRLAVLSKALASLRSGDHRLRELNAKLTAATKAVDELTKPAAAGASKESRNAFRADLGLPPLD